MGAISTTGIAGLTLGGGLGWLMPKFGLAADNVIAIELVTADGEIVEVTDESDPDLFWALRGGGGNFGVATAFTYRLHPLGMVTGGLIAHPIDAAPGLLRFYRDAVADASDDLEVFAGLVHAPDGSGMQLSALVVCHTGDPDRAEADLAPFKAWGSPLVVEVGPMPYPAMNTILDEGYPTGSLNYWMSSFTGGITDALIDVAVERFRTTPSPMNAILFEHFHGAVTRVPVTETAVPHRQEGFNLLIPSVWLDPADTEKNKTWTRETHAALSEHLVERRWLNYLTDDQGAGAVRAAYGPNWERLVKVKARVDPENVFHRNQNIPPADPGPPPRPYASAMTPIEMRKPGAPLQRRHERALADRRVAREPADPLLVERVELGRVAQRPVRPDDLVERAARRLELGLQVRAGTGASAP